MEINTGVPKCSCGHDLVLIRIDDDAGNKTLTWQCVGCGRTI